MFPSGGATTVVAQAITWSPASKALSSFKQKLIWLDMCPGVNTASRAQPFPFITSPSDKETSGLKPESMLASSRKPESTFGFENDDEAYVFAPVAALSFPARG